MNWDQVEERWMQVAKSFREKFGQFTNDDVEKLEGKKDQLAGTLQERYGHSKEDAERHLEDWRESLNDEKVPTSTSGASTY